jgi:3-methyladenine DNA glycosylase AlkD
MLREAWKKKPDQIEAFLMGNAQSMPRVMLRYALEKVNADLKNELMSAGQLRVKRK